MPGSRPPPPCQELRQHGKRSKMETPSCALTTSSETGMRRKRILADEESDDNDDNNSDIPGALAAPEHRWLLLRPIPDAALPELLLPAQWRLLYTPRSHGRHGAHEELVTYYGSGALMYLVNGFIALSYRHDRIVTMAIMVLAIIQGVLMAVLALFVKML
ncbi:uncharacterized protein [Dermacentor andersoni]|uniref:uncharacterized protein isoform X1 n=1 Tax=Dermacentor andersoni TaxID=34620 RepID=UPI0024162615|nr:uncharacterized protein LOC129384846 isoform X2 [Dermacentor andersoni]